MLYEGTNDLVFQNNNIVKDGVAVVQCQQNVKWDFKKIKDSFPINCRYVAVYSHLFTDEKIGFTQDCKTYKIYVCSKPPTGGCS